MRRTLAVAALILCAMASGCATNPPLTREQVSTAGIDQVEREWHHVSQLKMMFTGEWGTSDAYRSALRERAIVLLKSDWEPGDEDLVRRGEIRKGFDELQVLYSWGAPNYVTRSQTSEGEWATFHYGHLRGHQDTCCTFENASLVYWTHHDH